MCSQVFNMKYDDNIIENIELMKNVSEMIKTYDNICISIKFDKVSIIFGNIGIQLMIHSNNYKNFISLVNALTKCIRKKIVIFEIEVTVVTDMIYDLFNAVFEIENLSIVYNCIFRTILDVNNDINITKKLLNLKFDNIVLTDPPNSVLKMFKTKYTVPYIGINVTLYSNNFIEDIIDTSDKFEILKTRQNVYDDVLYSTVVSLSAMQVEYAKYNTLAYHRINDIVIV